MKNTYISLHLALLKRWESQKIVWIFMILRKLYWVVYLHFSYLYLSNMLIFGDFQLIYILSCLILIFLIWLSFFFLTSKVDLSHWRHLGSLSLFFKVINDIHQPFYSKISAHVVSQQNTRQAVNQNDIGFVMNRCLTENNSLENWFLIL